MVKMCFTCYWKEVYARLAPLEKRPPFCRKTYLELVQDNACSNVRVHKPVTVMATTSRARAHNQTLKHEKCTIKYQGAESWGNPSVAGRSPPLSWTQCLRHLAQKNSCDLFRQNYFVCEQ